MKIYLISQDVNNGYDTYSDAVVCAENVEEAKKIHPNGEYDYIEEDGEEKYDSNYGSWVKKQYVKVEEIGEANQTQTKGVICASFHAG